jgi:tetratricopeptide (TPR) repeat protein
MRRPIFQFFCKNDELSKRKPPFIVSTLLSQLLDHPELMAYQDRIVALITMEYNKNKDITKVSMDALCALLGSVLLNLPPVIIIIDALDECDAESLSRGFLIEKFIQLSDSVTGTKVILTSRQEEPFVEMIEQCTSLEMSKDDVSNDIEAVIRKSIESIPKLESLKDKVISALVANADGMFLWAELMLASLKKARNRNAVEKMLTNLPVGLREMYEHILISIGRKLSDDELHFRREIFSWVTTAVRPMTLTELSIALAIELDTTSLDDGEIILKLESDIRDLCGPMLRISGDGIVQVVHMSVRDMLHRPTQPVNWPKLSQADQKYLVGFTTEIEHAHLASACITYLAFEVFRDHEIMNRALRPPEELTSVAKEHLMLEYATSHWIYHICASANAGTKLLNRVLEFLQSDNAYIWIQLISAFNRRPGADFSIHTLQRAKLLDWARSISKQKGSESNEIINTYLVRAMQAGVELSQTSLGDNHVQTLQALQRLAYLYDHEDRLEESRAIHQTVIEITTGTTDHEAQQVLRDSCIELAYIYRLKANYDQAVNLLELVLGGPDPSKWTCDSTSAEAMADLSVVYRHKGDLDRAREIGEKGAEGLTVTMGPTDILTIRYVIELCRTYFECGLYDKAQALLEHTLKTADEVMGPEQSRTLHGRDLLGNILHAKGELDTAETLLRDVLRLMQQQCGEGGRSTALVKTHVADVLVDKGEWAEASVLYAGAAETYDGFYGVEHPNTRGLAFKLARCYRELALVDSAESVMAKYRVSLDDVKDADLVKRVFASNLKDVTAETEKGPGNVVVEAESVRTADIPLPPSDKPRSNASPLVEEVLVHNEKKWNDAMLYVNVCNALPAAVAF